jgi:esterase/lipase superfamily enzyme
MQEEYRKWHSENLSRDVEMLVIGEKGYPVILFPTSMGHYNQNKDFGLTDSAGWFIDNGFVKIYCIDGIDELSWYNKNIHPAERARNHEWYDKMLLHELVPVCQRETGVERIITAGCSFGGYHATNFGFRHPEVVKYIINMGAAYDIKAQVDGYYDDEVYFNNPPDFLPGSQNPYFNDMFVFLGTGTEDSCLAANQRMDQILNEKGIHHWLDIRQGANHDWPVWKQMFPHYLSLIVKTS